MKKYNSIIENYSFSKFTIVIVIKSIKLFQRIMLFFKIMYICKYVYFVYWCWVMQPRYDVKMYLDSHKPINAEWPSLNSNKTIKNYNPHIILTKGVKFGTWSNCDQTYRNLSVYYLCINDTLTYPNFLPQSYIWQLEVL
jgi:hypothetical protein